MRKPTIDDLLDHEPSLYTLTMLAAKRARQLKMLDKETKLPLQRALDEIASGKITASFRSYEIDDEQLIEGMKPVSSAPESQPIPPSEFDDEEDLKQSRFLHEN